METTDPQHTPFEDERHSGEDLTQNDELRDRTMTPDQNDQDGNVVNREADEVTGEHPYGNPPTPVDDDHEIEHINQHSDENIPIDKAD